MDPLKTVLEKIDTIDEGIQGQGKALEEFAKRIEVVESGMAEVKAATQKTHEILGFEARNAPSEARNVCAKYYDLLISRDHVGMKKLMHEKKEHFLSVERAITDDVLYTGANAQGAYLVPAPIYNEVYRIQEQASVLYPLVTKIPQSSKTLALPTLATKPTVSYADEFGVKTVTKPALGSVTLTLKKPYVTTVLSMELLEDNLFRNGLVNQLTTWISEAIAADFDLRVTNDAATPYVGLLYDTSVNNVAMTEDTAAAGLSFDYLSQMVDQIVANAVGGCKWLMHRTVLGAIRRLKDSTGAYLWAPANGANPQTIMGYPVLVSEQMPTLTAGTTGVSFLLFGDFKYWVCGEGMGLTFRSSDTASVTLDSTLTSGFEYNFVTIIAELRRSGAASVPTAFCRLTVG